MRKDSVLSLLCGIGAQMAAVNFIQRTVYELEDDGDVTELIADNLEEAYTGLETARDNLLDLAKEMEE